MTALNVQSQQEGDVSDITVTAVPGPDPLSLAAGAPRGMMLDPHTDVLY